jgi:CRP/FNR family transcriptional regulator, cyclic AMP receptor protein
VESFSLLAEEPELGAGLGAGEREAAARDVQVPVMRLPAGLWEPPPENEGGGLGYLLRSGTLLRRVTIEGGCSVELLGPGDCLFPWREESASFSRAEWRVVNHARLAVLDLRPGAVLSRWPSIGAEIAGRAIDRSRALALQSAIMSIVGVEERLSTLLWGLAERWGRTVPGGAEVEVDVPQSVLAEMIGARRPTVSKALGSLCDQGLIGSPRQGQWLLHGEPPTLAAGPSSD